MRAHTHTPLCIQNDHNCMCLTYITIKVGFPTCLANLVLWKSHVRNPLRQKYDTNLHVDRLTAGHK